MESKLLFLAGLMLAGVVQAQEAMPDSGQPDDATYRVEVLAEGLEYPWSLAQLPDGSLLITEKVGGLVHLSADFQTWRSLAGVPQVAWIGQGGLLDIVLHPEFGLEAQHWIYLSYSKPCSTGFTTALSRYRLRDGELADGQVLFEARPCGGLTWHFAGRLAFDAEGMLYLTVGDRGERMRAQQLDTHWGKLVRLHADGRVPVGNPFFEEPGALPEIYSYGHRNAQGLALHPESGEIWLHEHGPRGGDELNRVRAGANYGWPRATHGRGHMGGIISELTHAPGIEPPLWHWTPSIAPSGLAIYAGEPFAAWRGQFLIGALKLRQVHRVRLAPGGEVAEAVLPQPQGERIRDVRVLADGLIYMLTDAAEGRLLRLAPEADF